MTFSPLEKLPCDCIEGSWAAGVTLQSQALVWATPPSSTNIPTQTLNSFSLSQPRCRTQDLQQSPSTNPENPKQQRRRINKMARSPEPPGLDAPCHQHTLGKVRGLGKQTPLLDLGPGEAVQGPVATVATGLRG
mmetsp:Transcript_42045/g.65738  ORF Transcript_42045/g.65738 Transcript_42045/m.65738 type:complete len:134 (-) Transcript_42045:10-411(-)